MSASEGAGGLLTPGRDSLAVAGLQNPSAQVAPPQQMHLPFNTDSTAGVYNPVAGSFQPFQSSAAVEAASGTGMGFQQPQQQKKRGRPRKYANTGVPPGGGTFSPPNAAQAQTLPPSQATPPNSGGLNSAPPVKKGRGRPPGSSTGSGKKHQRQQQQHFQFQLQDQQLQLDALGSGGYGFTPHIINVNAGEDLSSKIMSFSQSGPRDVCIISASGTVSNVTLRQAATSGGTATYEGRFEILSLSGSFLLTEIGGQRTRTGGLSIALTGPDGRVLGGSVAGLLTAASPVQVIVGSFIANAAKEPKPGNNMHPFSGPLRVNPSGNPGASSPPSHGTLSESSGGPGSPPNLSGSCPNNGLGMSNLPWK